MADPAAPAPPPKPVYKPGWAQPHPAEPAKAHLEKDFPCPAPLVGIAIEPAGKYVFAGTQDFSIQRIDLESGQVTPLKGHTSWVRGLAGTPDGQTLVSGGYDGRLLFWPAAAESPQPARSVEDAHQGWIRAVRVSGDGGLIATCGNDHLVKLWTPDGQPVRQFAGHERHVYNVAFHPGGKSLASMDLVGRIIEWDIATGNLVREFDGKKLHKYDPTFHADIGGARSIAFSPDGAYLACGGITNVSNAFAGIGNPAVLLLDWASGQEVHLLKSKGNLQGAAWGVAFHPAGFVIGCVGGGGNNLLFWKPDQEKEADLDFHRLGLPSDGRDMALHPDGLRIAVAHFDGKVRLFRLAEKAKG